MYKNLRLIDHRLPKINTAKTSLNRLSTIGLNRFVPAWPMAQCLSCCSCAMLGLRTALSTTQCLAVMRFTPHPPFSIISFWPENQTPATIYNYFPVPGARTPCPGANNNNQIISIHPTDCNIKTIF